jgi:excisionase family DNA binding protein
MNDLPNKALFRVDEVADYFSVTERCIRLWIEHGHLESEKIVGVVRITREAVLKCRFFNKKTVDLQDDK